MYETSFGVCRSLSLPVSKLALYEAVMVPGLPCLAPEARCRLSVALLAETLPTEKQASGLFVTNMNMAFSLLKVFRV